MEGPLRPPVDPGFRLIETFRWQPGEGIVRRARHLARLQRSAARLGIVPRGVQGALNGPHGDDPLRVRLTVDAVGRAEATYTPFVPLPAGTVWRVQLAEARLESTDPWLSVKTTRRELYDRARADMPGGVDELIFLNEKGELCEGTITNLFVRIRKRLLTPPVRCGLLPGALREAMLEAGEATESILMPESLLDAEEIFVGNSLRGLIAAELAG